MSLGYFLLEEGLDVELMAGMDEIIALLDNEVPSFTHDSYGYRVVPLKGVLGTLWRLNIKPRDLENNIELTPTVGTIEVDKLPDGATSFKIPPRDQWGDEEARTFDPDGNIFAGFIFQILNAFQRKGYIDLPGELPIR
jgi:hypothetical protein